MGVYVYALSLLCFRLDSMALVGGRSTECKELEDPESSSGDEPLLLNIHP